MVAVFKGFILKTLPSKKPRIWSGFLLPAWFFFVCVCRNSAASMTWKIPYLQELFIHHPAFLIMLLALLRRLSQKKICCWFPRCYIDFCAVVCDSCSCSLVPRAASLQGAGLCCKGHGMPPLGIGFSKAFLSAFSRPTTGFSFNCPLAAFSYRRKKKKRKRKKSDFPALKSPCLKSY